MSRRSSLRRIGIVVLLVNVGLAILKGIIWWQTGSLAVGSEAVNSVADSIYSLVVVGGLFLTTRPPDPEHPHGHERIEPFVSLLVSVAIFIAGGLVVREAITSLLTDSPGSQFGIAAIAVLVVSAVVKFGLYRYCLVVGEENQSPAILAIGLDNRNDILTALAALVGVLGVRFGYALLDPIAALLVSIGIFYTGWQVVRDNLAYLLGRAPPESIRQEIINRALSHPDVHGAHDVVAHYVGPEVDVSLHIEVEGDRTLQEAHVIETEVVESIRELGSIDDVFVHIDPKELGEWKSNDELDELADSDQF